MDSLDKQANGIHAGGEKQSFAVRRLAALAALRKIAKIVDDERKADAAEKKWFPRITALAIVLVGIFLMLTLYPKPIPYTHTGVTAREVTQTLKFTNGESLVVTVPAGARCIKLTRAFTPWVVDDADFMKGKSAFLVKYVKDYGIQIPESELRDITPSEIDK